MLRKREEESGMKGVFDGWVEGQRQWMVCRERLAVQVSPIEAVVVGRK